ncbi:hypothetical protein ACVIGB_000398 [Bradyrhizobium sp. USDA 4341]
MVRPWLSILALTSIALGGCALPKSEQLPSPTALKDQHAAKMALDQGIAVERIRVPRDSFKPNRLASPLPLKMRSKPIEVKFGAGGTLGDLVQSLSVQDIQIGFKFNEIAEGGSGVGGYGQSGGFGSGGRNSRNNGGMNGFGSNNGFGSGGFGNSGFGNSGYGGNYGSNSSGSNYGRSNYGSSNYGSNSYGSTTYGGGIGSGNGLFNNGNQYGSAFGNNRLGGTNGRNNSNGGSLLGGRGVGQGVGQGQVVDRQEVMLQRRLPFTHYSGTVGGLMDSLRKGLGVVVSYEDDMVFVSDRERYSVTLPQNEDVIGAVADEIRSLGGEGIVPSVRGGRIIYSASPATQDSVIGPYLDRLARNMAVINVQAAVVSLSLTDTTSTGFDWSKFQVALEGRKSRLTPSTSTTDTTSSNSTNGNTNTNTNTNSSTGTSTSACSNTLPTTGSPLDATGLCAIDPGSVVNLSNAGLVLGKTSLGNYFGTYGALSVASAINFLSQFGNAKIDQNVQLKTLSGTDVNFRSGQTVPYVSGVAATTTANSSNVTGSSATDKVDTGLTVAMTPYYDADTQLVTMEVALSLRSILQFVQLNAGNQLGTFTQPLTQDQELTDIVRTPAGRTIVIGGLQIDNEQFNGSEPVGLRNLFANAGTTPDVLSGRSQQIKRDALFVILRPTVQVFVPEGR